MNVHHVLQCEDTRDPLSCAHHHAWSCTDALTWATLARWYHLLLTPPLRFKATIKLGLVCVRRRLLFISSKKHWQKFFKDGMFMKQLCSTIGLNQWFRITHDYTIQDKNTWSQPQDTYAYGITGRRASITVNRSDQICDNAAVNMT